MVSRWTRSLWPPWLARPPPRAWKRGCEASTNDTRRSTAVQRAPSASCGPDAARLSRGAAESQRPPGAFLSPTWAVLIALDAVRLIGCQGLRARRHGPRRLSGPGWRGGRCLRMLGSELDLTAWTDAEARGAK